MLFIFAFELVLIEKPHLLKFSYKPINLALEAQIV